MDGSAASMQGPFPVVLVITHHANRLLNLQKLFRTHGMQVITAVNGADGVRAATEHLPDAVVAEAHMPILDGYALAHILQGNPTTAEIPVLLLAHSSGERASDWRRYVGVAAVLDERAGAGALAQAVSDAVRRKALHARPQSAPSADPVQTPITDLVARAVIRAEIVKLARYTGVGNRHQIARAMFDVLSAAVEYRAAGVYFLQPTYATFFMHTRETLPSDQVNGLLWSAVAPLREALQGSIRLELFAGDEKTPRELGRWTPRPLAIPAELPIAACLLQWASETLGTLVVLPVAPAGPRLDMMLRHFAEQFAQVLAGLYFYEECQLLRRDRASSAQRPAQGAQAHNAGVVERLLRGEFGPLNPAQYRALLNLRGTSEAEHVVLAVDEERREPTDPRALVYEVCGQVQPLMQERHLRFEARLPPSVPPLLLDRPAMAGALTHLLRNAARFTPPGGAVTLWVVVEEQQVRIAVRDSGAGMDPALVRAIYTPAANGAGGAVAGLRQCLSTVERHGGVLHVDSTPGKGSLIVIGLPLSTVDTGARPGDRRVT